MAIRSLGVRLGCSPPSKRDLTARDLRNLGVDGHERRGEVGACALQLRATPCALTQLRLNDRAEGLRGRGGVGSGLRWRARPLVGPDCRVALDDVWSAASAASIVSNLLGRRLGHLGRRALAALGTLRPPTTLASLRTGRLHRRLRPRLCRRLRPRLQGGHRCAPGLGAFLRTLGRSGR